MKSEQYFFKGPEQKQDILGLYEKAEGLLDIIPINPQKKILEESLEKCFEDNNPEGIKNIIKKAEDILKKIAEMGTEKFPGCEKETEDEKQIRKILDGIMEDESNFLGFGRTAKVYINKNFPKYCFKVIYGLKSYREGNDVEKEFDLMTEIASLKIDGVRTPKPYYCLENNKSHVLVMETIQGATLEEIMDGARELPPNVDWNEFFNGLRKFVEEINRKGIYHKDLVPKNVMIDFNTLKPVVIDFGQGESAKIGDDERLANNEINDLLKTEKDFKSKMKLK